MKKDTQRIDMKKTLLSRFVPAIMTHGEIVSSIMLMGEITKFKKYNKGLSDFIIKASLYDGPSGKILGK
ncbi:hypothetical protein SJ_08 [Proteus phage SJ_PmiM]|nr:hypothetical protein SJ_08 [Proteus phage SJ_PmiM]